MGNVRKPKVRGKEKKKKHKKRSGDKGGNPTGSRKEKGICHRRSRKGLTGKIKFDGGGGADKR